MNHQTIPVVWTNDDISVGLAAKLSRELAFLDQYHIPGVFFIIPVSQGKTLCEDKELLDVIQNAKLNGHEFYMHGHVHHPFECGTPDLDMLELDLSARRLYDEGRATIDAMHTFEAQVEMLEKGRRIWRQAFGEESQGFRPPYGAFCNNFYRALAVLGFQWVSSRMPCFTSWNRYRGFWDAPIYFRDAIPTKPHQLPQGIWEFPIAGDYALRVPNDPTRVDSMVDLGLGEFEVYYERRDPMLIISHHQGLENLRDTGEGSSCPRGTGYMVHEKLIPALLESERARFIGMKELVKGYIL